MKNKTLQAIFAFALLGLGTAAYGQDAAYPEPVASVSPTEKTVLTPQSSSHSAVRFHKRFPQLFTGMAIEIASATYPMEMSNPIFRQFGNVRYEKLPEGGYSYLIMANFSSKEAALEFLQNVVKPKSEDARLIQYSEGNRKVVRE